jgi:hypothetical protein
MQYAEPMVHRGEFWKLEHLSNRELIESVRGVLQTQQRTLGELVAHLGEIEERRLHLEAAHPSLFDYCVSRLHMSEDEACRRIELARLARRFPVLFPLIASGELSLSVALLLKPVLTQENQSELLAAVRGNTIRQAREALAARFPSPDVPSRIRKLPERRPAEAPPSASRAPLPSSEPGRVPSVQHEPAPPMAPPLASQPSPLQIDAPAQLPAPAAAQLPSATIGEPEHHRQSSLVLAPPAAHGRIDPIAAQRYRVQFTADASTKEKLEMARDLLRHTYPNGDLGSIVSRALDVLIADLQRTRFGFGARPNVAARRPAPAGPAVSASGESTGKPGAPLEESSTASGDSTPDHSHVSRPSRRAVLERDGLACTWVDESGKRCGSRAWLELDHHHPRGKGGGSETDNIRMLCRAHNQLAAERAYGRAHMARARQARRKKRGRATSSPINDASFDG